jgi:type 1 glutamine amidotransferase
MNGMIDAALSRHWFMHTSHVSVGLGAAKPREAQSPPSAIMPPLPAEEVRTLRVGLIAGPEAAWDMAAARMAEHLRKDQRLDVFYAWDCVEFGIDDPHDYDCLVLFGWPSASNRELVKRIEVHCRNGGSIVALRAMHAEISGWPNFAEEVFGGRQPQRHRSRLLEVQRSENAWHHPVVDGVETLIAEGEVYCGPRFSPDTTVLLTAHDGQRQRPVAWTTRYAGGRVFCSTLGQDDDFREPDFLRLISNAVHWSGLVHA